MKFDIVHIHAEGSAATCWLTNAGENVSQSLCMGIHRILAEKIGVDSRVKETKDR